jgi:hypothetical protein
MLCPRTSRRWRTYLLAGALAGVAAAARFHFALVSLPVLLALYVFEDRPVLDLGGLAAPRRTLYVLAALLGAMFIGGGVVTLLLRHQLLLPNRLTQAMLLSTAGGAAEYAAAKQLMAAVWLLLAGVAVTIFIPQCFSAGRRSLRPIVNAYTMCLALGFSGGFLLAHPTFLWRGEHQLRSIQFYSEWVNPDLLTLAPLWAWWRVTARYFDLALPEFWLKSLFLVGIVFLLWRRHAVHAAFLVAALACFVSHPVTMKLWPHHVIPWLPFLSFVAAYPIGYLASEVTRKFHRPALSVALLLAVMASLLWALSPRLAKADEYLKVSAARTKQIAEMTEWIAEHVPEGSLLMLSYYSLNRDGFFKLIENAGIPIPDDVKRRRDLRIWWLDRNALTGREGYVCVSRADIALFRDDFERRQPGSTYNPFEDRRFEPLALFGGGFYELQVFKFDFRSARTAG